MTFEEQLRNDLKSLPTADLTDNKRRNVFDKVHEHARIKPKFRMSPVITSAVAGVGVVVVCVLGTSVFGYSHRSRLAGSYSSATASNATSSAVAHEASILDTPAFRSVVEKYVLSHYTGDGKTTDGGPPLSLPDLKVAWSEAQGENGFAVVTFSINQHSYLAGVLASNAAGGQWNIQRLSQSPPLTQNSLKGFPFYNGEMSGTSVGPSGLSYFMVFGLVNDPSISRIQMTWPDGTLTNVPVRNRVYGYVQTFPSSVRSVHGPREIAGYTSNGLLVYKQ